MFLEYLKLIFGFAALYFGAEWLVRGSAKLANHYKVSHLIIGLTIVAFGTSAPELFVSLQANMIESSGISLGNIVGSNICNIGLILGSAALIFTLPVAKIVIYRDWLFLIIISIIFTIMIYWGASINRFEGAVLFFILLLYLFNFFLKKKGKKHSKTNQGDFSQEIEQELKEIINEKDKNKLFIFIIMIIFGLILLIFGSNILVSGAKEIARNFGVNEAVIGLSMVAFGTSLPELATVVSAACKKHSELIVGNAIGSCIFNLLAVIGLTALIKPINASSMQKGDLITMLLITIISAVFANFFKKINRFFAIFLLLFYSIYIILLFMNKQY